MSKTETKPRVRSRPNARLSKSIAELEAPLKSRAESEARLKRVAEVDRPKAPATYARDKWGVDRATFARMTGVSERTIGEWERSGPKGGSNLRAIIVLDRLYDSLCRVVKPEHILPWLKATNPAFDPLTPIEILERGQIDRIWRMIFEMETGNSF